VFRRPKLLVDELALNIDLAPTLLELAGKPVPREVQGTSLVPLLSGRRVRWRDAFLFAYYFEPNLPATPAMLSVRSRDAKLTVYPGHDDWTELFELKRDPYELLNRARDPKYAGLLAKMQKELSRQKIQFGDPFLRGSSAYNQ
jgi:arylsulfatase A-like enzyme